jgi:NADH-quinone oxidoreductase subunit C
MEEPRDPKGQDGQEKPPAPPPPKPKPPPDPLKQEVPSVPLDRLRESFPDAIQEVSYHAGQVTVRLAVEDLLEITAFLRDDEACDCALLMDLCGADYPDREERFEVVYHLYSVSHGHFLRVKVQVADGGEVPSVTSIWSTANWFEREVFDLFGVGFQDHPDLRRILLPEHWRGHPLRKEYPLAGFADLHLKLR